MLSFFSKGRLCDPPCLVKKKRGSPQPALVEKNAPPLWILSPPGAIICESRHYRVVPCRYIVLVMNTLNLNTHESWQDYWKYLTFFILPHSPGSEFLLPMRPTKMSCISPDKNNENQSLLCFMMILKNCKKETAYSCEITKLLLFCGDCTAFGSGKIKWNQKGKKDSFVTWELEKRKIQIKVSRDI